jgi:hypothetical protein
MAILIGIWIIAGYFGKSGVPSWLSVQALKISGGRPGGQACQDHRCEDHRVVRGTGAHAHDLHGAVSRRLRDTRRTQGAGREGRGPAPCLSRETRGKGRGAREVRPLQRRVPRKSDPGRREEGKVRPDLHGVARPSRVPQFAARQPDRQGSCGLLGPGAGPPAELGRLPTACFRGERSVPDAPLVPHGRDVARPRCRSGPACEPDPGQPAYPTQAGCCVRKGGSRIFGQRPSRASRGLRVTQASRAGILYTRAAASHQRAPRLSARPEPGAARTAAGGRTAATPGDSGAAAMSQLSHLPITIRRRHAVALRPGLRSTGQT